jgi:hypothetical protein
MASIIYGNIQNQSNREILQKDLGYDYPEDLDLRPGSKTHNRIKHEVLSRARESAAVMSSRFDSWNSIDKVLTSYIPLDVAEKLVKEDDPRKPVSIVFPYTYAIMETLLSYLTVAFLQDPIFRYEGMGPKDVIGAILLEKVIEMQCIRHKVALNIHTMLRDSISYGLGAVGPTWRVTEHFEGNALENIDPYLFLPDSNVAVHELQKGEYCGYVSKTNYYDLLNDELNASSDLFNCKYLKGLKGQRTAIYTNDNSMRNIKSGVTTAKLNTDLTFPVDVIRMYIKIIPKDWELSDYEYPELWQFALGSDEVVLEARPAGFNHQMIPITVCAPDFDGYSAVPLSRLEVLQGLQTTLDWLFNSHVANVRKAINDMIIVDPFLVNINDLKSPEPGKIIRTRRPAWGRGVKDAVQQLAISDITRGNIADSGWIVQWMQKISGADDSMMGSLRQGGPERLTGAEFKGTRTGAVSRLERVARIIGIQSMQDIGFFFASHCQQMMTQELFVKANGEWEPVLRSEFGTPDRGRIPVAPDQLNINYNIIPRDGSVPGGNFSEAWIQLFNILGQNPELAQRFDVVRIFTHIARNLGAKNVNDFVRRGGNINPTIQQDAQVTDQAQSGNLVPMGGLNAGLLS